MVPVAEALNTDALPEVSTALSQNQRVSPPLMPERA